MANESDFSNSAACAHVRMAQVLFGSDYPYRTGEDHVKGIIDCGFSQATLMRSAVAMLSG